MRRAQVKNPQFMGYKRLNEIKRHEQRVYNTEDLVDTYFYMNLVGNLGLIRRTLIEDMFKGKDEMVLNYNPHSSPRVGIGKFIIPKEYRGDLIEALRKRCIERLPPE